MGYDFLIFDLDGTVIDSQRDIAFAVNEVRKELGFAPLTIDKIRSYLGNGVKALVGRAVPEADSEILASAFEKFKFYYGRCLTDTTLPYDGMEETLLALNSKKKAILSNKMEIFSCEIVKRLGIAEYFVEVWGGDTSGVKKPDPKPIFDLIKKTNSKPEKTIMIGDSENDIKAAKAAGIASLAVLYGYTDIVRIKEHKPDYIAAKPEEIIKIVS